MKRVNIILVALSLLLVGQLWAQQNRTPWHSMSELPYRPWSTFEGDTARYLEFNFTIRQMQYIGWTVSELLEELEFPVIYVTVANATSNRLRALIFGIRQEFNTPGSTMDYFIGVGFENPLCFEEFRKVSPIGNTDFTPELYSFIRDWRISWVESNQWILRDPELVEERRRIFGDYDRQGREARNERIRQERAREREENRRREQSRAR